jgi:predicted DNA binding protein
MAVIAEFVVPSADFDIGRVFADLPGVTVEMDRLVPAGEVVIPYLWIDGVSADTVTETMNAHDAVRSASVIDEVFGRGLLVRMEWSRSVENTVVEISRMNITILTARGDDSEWYFEFRAECRANVAEFVDSLARREVAARLVRIHDPSIDGFGSVERLTERQYEALLLAYEAGYFDDDRKTSLEELAAVLGISRQALAGRIRRATRNLIEQALVYT